MFTTYCTECGAPEGEGVMVLREDTETRKTSPNLTISEDIRTTFYCENCDIEETVNTGVLPEKDATYFEYRSTSIEESMSAQIDNQEISFEGVDEQIAENAYYTPDGVRGTSKVHHVHIHACNPPSISKGKHRVVIGDYIDEEMILGTVRYHDDKSRTLKFFRSLDDDVMEPLDNESSNSLEIRAERF